MDPDASSTSSVLTVQKLVSRTLSRVLQGFNSGGSTSQHGVGSEHLIKDSVGLIIGHNSSPSRIKGQGVSKSLRKSPRTSDNVKNGRGITNGYKRNDLVTVSDNKDTLLSNMTTKRTTTMTLDKNNNDNNRNDARERSNINFHGCVCLHRASAPHYLTFNPYIQNGYRRCADWKQCLRSAFHLTNESVNIWTHFLGWIYFLYLTVDLVASNKSSHQDYDDYIVTLFMLIAFQACMFLSSLYHTFCCLSDRAYRLWLSADLFGVSMALLAIYLSGIYFAFKDNQFWLQFYFSFVMILFLSCCGLQFLTQNTEETFMYRLTLFTTWAAFGIIPTTHWTLWQETVDPIHHRQIITLTLEVAWMYGLSMTAFVVYISRIPERFFPGKVDIIGSSHQFWHVIIFFALKHWLGVAQRVFLHQKGVTTDGFKFY